MIAARINVISTHMNSISCSILFTFWLVRMLKDEGLPYPVVVLAHYWQRVAFVSYFAMRSVNRIIKIIFLINFDWMNSLSECLLTSASILTTLASVLGRNESFYCLTCNLLTGACGAEYFYREKYHLWHIGRSDQSAYLYNLTGTEKLQLEATTTRTTG